MAAKHKTTTAGYVPLSREEEAVKRGAIMEKFREWDAAIDASQPSEGRPKFFLTTAINYTNGPPHIGHAYEGTVSDIIVRYYRSFGHRTFFLTGTDEHGQKIANQAKAEGIEPIDLCTKYANKFQDLNRRLLVSNDYYIRTTMPHHHQTVQWLVRTVKEKGDVYLGQYKGWYNVREETFVSESDAKEADYKDVVTGNPLTEMEESSYFFRMSKYQERLIQHINANPTFIQPDKARVGILERLKEPLMDLSMSRTTFDWGIPFPDDADHVLYVWFDALTNYLTGVKYPTEVHGEDPWTSLWPANVHMIGKDIVWFHCVIWPTILMSAEIPLPHQVYAHGFLTDKFGRKQSKSLGNVVDPNELLDKYPADAFRMYMVADFPLGGDVPFDEDKMIKAYNADISHKLGNLLNRCAAMLGKSCGGEVPNAPAERVFDVAATLGSITQAMTTFSMNTAYRDAMASVESTNVFFNERAPWHIEDADTRASVLRSAVEAVYIAAHFLAPILPETASIIFDRLHTPPRCLSSLSPNFDNLTPGTPVAGGEIPFPRLPDLPKDVPKPKPKGKQQQKKKDGGDGVKGKAKEKKEKKEKTGAAAGDAAASAPPPTTDAPTTTTTTATTPDAPTTEAPPTQEAPPVEDKKDDAA